MWLSLAFLSAALLGLYDVAKKKSLSGNAVLPVLLLNTLFSSLLFLPAILSAELGLGWFDSTPLAASRGTAEAHALVAVKSVIVLTSWIFGYFGMKHLPLTIVGPVNATRPVLVLVGALAVFGERLNGFQWIGVALALTSLVLLSRSGRREGVDFRHNVWILCLAAAAVTGAASGLYDKYIMTRLDPAFVQSWYNLYQLGMMAVVTALLWLPRRAASPFRWSWQAGAKRRSSNGLPSCWRWSGWKPVPKPIRPSFPAVRNSASPLPAHWLRPPRYCFVTRPPLLSTRRPPARS